MSGELIYQISSFHFVFAFFILLCGLLTSEIIHEIIHSNSAHILFAFHSVLNTALVVFYYSVLLFIISKIIFIFFIYYIIIKIYK